MTTRHKCGSKTPQKIEENRPQTHDHLRGISNCIGLMMEDEGTKSEKLNHALTNLTKELAEERQRSRIMNSNLQMLVKKWKNSKTVALRRHVGYFTGVGIIIGGMIGPGIFITPKGVLSGTGSVGLSLVVWAVCAIVSAIAALCYAELGQTVQSSGGEYAYLLEGLGPLPAFLYSWVYVIGRKPCSFALMSLVIPEYVAMPIFGECGSPEILKKTLAILTLLTVSALNSWSSKWSVRAQLVITVFKAALLVVIVVVGVVKLIQGGPTNTFNNVFERDQFSVNSIAFAFYNGLFAYNGWNYLNYITEEIEEPHKNLPRAIITAVLVVGAINVFANVSYFTVMTKSEILDSTAVAVQWGKRVLGSASVLIPIGVTLVALGSLNAGIIVIARLPYVAARKEHMPSFLSFVQIKNKTPLLSIVLINVMSMAMVMIGDIYVLINILGFLDWLFYGLTMISLLVMRRRQKESPKKSIKVPLILPITVLLISCYLIVAPLVQNPRTEFIYSAVFLLSGIAVYIPFIHFRLRFEFFDRFTACIQCLTETVPAQETDFDF